MIVFRKLSNCGGEAVNFKRQGCRQAGGKLSEAVSAKDARERRD